MRIFGFGHRSRMGKDTAATFLTGHLRQTTRGKLIIKSSFAAKLKAMTHDLYGWLGLETGEFYELPENEHLRNVKLPHINKTPVEVWIEFGTTVGRACYPETWVAYPLQKQCDYLILTDVRFPNEVAAIHKAGGKVFKVHNPTIRYRDSVADSQLEEFQGWDSVIINDGDLKHLNTLVINTFKDLL